MNLFFKKLMARYGVIFFFSFGAGFIILATLNKNLTFDLLPGDFLLQIDKFSLYLPFGSAIGLALLGTVGFEIYTYFKH